jgi:Domain of unknown function (DUF1992)
LSGFDLLAETKIAEAMRAGVFDNLPGAGKPLDLDADKLVPEDVRMAYRILKNAGFVPVEVEERKEVADLRKLIAVTADEPAKRRAVAKLALLEVRLQKSGTGLSAGGDYYAKLAAKLDRG